MKALRALLPGLSLVGVMSCGGGSVPLIGRVTPKPGTLSDPRNPAQRGAAIAYGDSLAWAFDSTHKYHGQFDRNLLDTQGTYGTITPEVGMHRLKRQQLDSGRIQLRIEITPGAGYLNGYAAGSYGRLGGTGEYRFPPGKSYVWVDQLTIYGAPHADTLGSAKIVVIPVDTTYGIDTTTVWMYTRAPFNEAVARWSPAMCWDCMRQSWCALH